MTEKTIDGIKIISDDIDDENLLQAYIDRANQKYGKGAVKTMTLTGDGEYVNIDYEFHNRPFERLRRITGYLVGTMDRWNNGKRAEEHDRVKHSV